MSRATTLDAVLLLPLLGCAATQPPAPRAPAEPAIVEAPARLTERLPPLPLRRADASPELQRGLELAEALLRQQGARFDGTDQEAFQEWMQRDFTAWMASMAKQIEEAQTALEAAAGDRRESVVAAAVVAACYGHFIELFLATPVPPVLRDDAELEAIFRQGLEQAAAPWMQKAEDAFAYCHITARRLDDSSLDSWAAHCAAREAALAQRRKAIAARPTRPQYGAEKRAGPGERPPGSEACWSPRAGEGPPDAAAPSAGAGRALVQLEGGVEVDIPLLEAERATLVERAQALLAKRYAAARLEVDWLAPAELARLQRAWQKGRHRVGGARCARGVRFDDFLRRSLPDLERARVSRRCDDSACELVIFLHGEAQAKIGFRLRAPLTGPHEELDTWLAALSALQAVPQKQGIIGILRASPGSWDAPAADGVKVHHIDSYGDWAEPGAARAVLDAHRGDLERCHHPDAPTELDFAAVLDIGEDGRVKGSYQPPRPRSQRTRDTCLARVLAKLRFQPATAKRRLGVRITTGELLTRTERDRKYGPRHVPSGVRVSLHGEDHAQVAPWPLTDLPVAGRLARCIAQEQANEAGTFELDLELSVTGSGKTRVAAVTPRDGSEATPSAALTRCMTRALRATTFACTANNKPTTVRATACLRRE
ncbi:MAG: hypothetical protein OXT09_20010 [Myxococcales bacterium]|nr:hypothetical protein [Myxococcales bacterium]